MLNFLLNFYYRCESYFDLNRVLFSNKQSQVQVYTAGHQTTHDKNYQQFCLTFFVFNYIFSGKKVMFCYDLIKSNMIKKK